ncbi:MAG: Teichoic acids export ATP-binding protein TagH (Teichoicacid-transporting ATPase) [uncultured bacterium]|nr:MAG: Teichoic acids export ATP-binding protein TagH (Teichoicacid-transporting ATPase) [uncultured bacterium]
MAKIDLRSVCVEFPVYNVQARSFKKNFLRFATGGKVSKDAHQHIIVSALNDITLSLRHGDRIGLIGHNGAGKSTLLRLLAKIYEPTRGNLRIEGHISPMLDLMQGIEIELTGYDNILIRGTLLGLSRAEINKQIDDIVELTGLGDYLAMPTRTYSSGMMVRLAFAITTSIQPDILLIDEIFGAGDADFMIKAKKKIASLLDQSSIVVMANHSDETIQEFCNKGLVLESGNIKYFGPLKEALAFYYNNQR